MTKFKKDLNQRFEEAVELASNTGREFPPDLRLYFYAYYKRALGNHRDDRQIDDGNTALVNAFKMNALFQVRNISEEEAKEKYIELVNRHVSK